MPENEIETKSEIVLGSIATGILKGEKSDLLAILARGNGALNGVTFFILQDNSLR